jgi:CBS domain-containing protein
MAGWAALAWWRIGAWSELVSKWMADAPDTFSPDVEVEEAAAWLLEVGYRHMPVMADGELLGIVSIRDILWAMVGGPTTE